ncbi:MAG: hypothetical protein M3Z94_06865 [Lactobacillus panisapium]|nr:hypothetical protein [Lactobacillus panisapium]
MKSKKIITLLAAATVTMTAATGVAATQAEQTQAASVKKSKYGFKKSFTFPTSWRGKWYSTNNLTPSPMNIQKTSFDTPWTNEHVKAVKVGKVKGTNKYPWQMTKAWKLKNAGVFAKYTRVTTKKMNGEKWIVLSPVDQKSTKKGYAFTVKTELIDGKKEPVLFQSHPQEGKVTNQFFTSEELAKKYATYEFKDMTYSKVNPRQ